MKRKILAAIVSLSFLLGSACSSREEPTDKDQENGLIKAIDNAIHYEYPDQLVTKEGGTACMTVFRCGSVCFACEDGSDSWGLLYSRGPLDIDEDEFIHVEADYDLAYGGVSGYMGNKGITKVRDEKTLTLDEVADNGSLSSYDLNSGSFSGLQLIQKDGKNYLICRDGLLQYRLYDDSMNLLCTYETPMAVAGYLDPKFDSTVQYESAVNVPCKIMRIGDVYYSYSSHIGLAQWTPLLNLQFENKPIGFELEDGQVMETDSTSVYIVNGGVENYTNAPMFERMDVIKRINYDELIGINPEKDWRWVSQYEDGEVYHYETLDGDRNMYVIFYMNDAFIIYCETNAEMETEKFFGEFSSPEEVNEAFGL